MWLAAALVVTIAPLPGNPAESGATAAPASSDTASSAAAQAGAPPTEAFNDLPRPASAEGSIVVFDTEASMQRAADELREEGLVAVDELPASAAIVVDDPAEVTVLESAPGVVAVEAVQEFSLAAPPASWGLDRIDQRRRPLDQATFRAGGGAGVTAYVIDSGIRGTHQEFVGRIPRSAYHDFGDGTGSEDCVGHGTHVAGTIGGTVHGVAKAVSIVPVKAFDCAGGTNTAILLGAINWIIADHLAGVPAVVNMSLTGPPTSVIDNAVQAMIADGITVVVAAGNVSQSSCGFSPARVAGAITVAASTTSDARASFSNTGSCNDLFAPGQEITSAWITNDTATAIVSGTSMAAPHVAGAAALELQANPTFTPAQVWAAIDAATTPFAVTGCCGDPSKLLFIGDLGVPPPCAVVNGYIAWWDADGTSAAIAGPDLSGTASHVPGRVGLGWSFGSASPSLSTTAPLSIGTSMSVEAWIEPVSPSTTQVIAGRWTFASSRDDDRSFALMLNPDNTLSLQVDDASSRRPTEVRAGFDPALLFDGIPHHVAATWAGGVSSLYLDGVLLATGAMLPGPLQAAADVPFRAAGTDGRVPSFRYVGMLDELTVYSRAITQAEVRAIVDAGRTGKCRPVVVD